MSTVDLTPAGDGTMLFMHIPKTGGTSMRKAVGDAYLSTERAFIYDQPGVRGAITTEAFLQGPAAERERLRLVLGHFRYGMHESVPGPSAYVAMLRHPVDRVVSAYSHYRHHKGIRYRLMSAGMRERDPAARERAAIEGSGFGLEEWVFGREPMGADNQMVRQIAGATGIGFGATNERLLTLAQEHIEDRFAVLLVQEEMGQSMRALSSLIGRPVAVGRRLKVNRRREPLDRIDPRVRERIAELNHLDMKLYRSARERLSEAAVLVS